jgi:peptide/nickel transport system substrate-binding protein
MLIDKMNLNWKFHRRGGRLLAYYFFQLIAFLTLFYLLSLQTLPASASSKTVIEKPPITIAIESNIRSFDSRYAVDANSQYLENLIHCSLIDFNKNGAIEPQLAKKRPEWVTPRSLRVQIRNDMYFSNGQKVTKKDVIATYEELSTNKTYPRSGAFRKLKSIQEDNSGHLLFELTEPDASFENNLVIGILPHKSLAQNPIDPLKTESCGPFKLADKTTNSIYLEANSYYPTAQRQKRRIELKVVKSEKTRLAKLRASEIDIAQNNINRDLIDDIERKYPNLKVLTGPALKTTYLGFNLQDTLAGKIQVRQAIAHAIHRESIIDLLLGGLAEPAYSMMPPHSAYYNHSLKERNLDIEKAKSILDKAGFPKKGEYRFTISYKTTTDSTRINIARAIASQLKKIGIKVLIEPLEWGRFKQDVENGRVQMWSLSWIGFKDPDIFRYAFASESFPPNGGNRGRYHNKTLDDLVHKGISTMTYAKRKKIYDEVQTIINDDLPYIFLWHDKNFAVVQKTIEGFDLYEDGRLFSLIKTTKE